MRILDLKALCNPGESTREYNQWDHHLMYWELVSQVLSQVLLVQLQDLLPLSMGPDLLERQYLVFHWNSVLELYWRFASISFTLSITGAFSGEHDISVAQFQVAKAMIGGSTGRVLLQEGEKPFI